MRMEVLAKEFIFDCQVRDLDPRTIRNYESGVVHHARLGSMESNVFTLIGNRMKGRRACWSVNGANHLALLLCADHTTGFENLFAAPTPKEELPVSGKSTSATAIGSKVGNGFCFWSTGSLPETKWIREVTGFASFADMALI